MAKANVSGGPWFCASCSRADFPFLWKPTSAKLLTSDNRADPLRRTVLMCALEDSTMHSQEDGQVEQPHADKHAYLKYLFSQSDLKHKLNVNALDEVSSKERRETKEEANCWRADKMAR